MITYIAIPIGIGNQNKELYNIHLHLLNSFIIPFNGAVRAIQRKAWLRFSKQTSFFLPSKFTPHSHLCHGTTDSTLADESFSIYICGMVCFPLPI